jgi:hypothetical protein
LDRSAGNGNAGETPAVPGGGGINSSLIIFRMLSIKENEIVRTGLG